MKRKKTMLLVVLLMAVGFAAVSTTLYINGQTKINANQDDFNVYYSDALVNGVQDLSVVTDDTHISFTTTLETLGEQYVLDYDVTNGSKNYDAELEMTCTAGNEYLTVTNEFDTDENLAALATRSGKLTLELIQSYAGETDMEVTIECTIDANAIERDALGEGEAASPVKQLAKWTHTDSDSNGSVSVGDVMTLGTEIPQTFNVISTTDDTVTMLASNVLGTDYRQTTSTTYSEYGVAFASTNGWGYTPGPKEIDIQTWSTNPKDYVNSYVSYLQTETGDTSITSNLITLAELKTLGCTINDDYSYTSGLTCANSSNAEWLVNGQYWWTRSANTASSGGVWSVHPDGYLYSTGYYNTFYGVRPVITISKADLESL